ncbi:MAG: hypothetical protein ACR2GX_07470 [Candidatus Dormibacteria bacterium]
MTSAHTTATGLRIPVPASGTARNATWMARLVGAALLIAIGVIHVGLASMYIDQAAYIGILFYALLPAGLIAAALIIAGIRGGWILGVLIAAGAIIGLLLSSTIGLPQFMDSLTAPGATPSLLVEIAYIAVFIVSARVKRSPLGP